MYLARLPDGAKWPQLYEVDANPLLHKPYARRYRSKPEHLIRSSGIVALGRNGVDAIRRLRDLQASERMLKSAAVA